MRWRLSFCLGSEIPMRECDGAACGQEAAYPAAPLLCLPLLVVSVADQLKEEGSREW